MATWTCPLPRCTHETSSVHEQKAHGRAVYTCTYLGGTADGRGYDVQ